MHKIIFLMFLMFSLAVMCTGCTSESIKLESDATILNKQEIPVKFKFSTISWNTTGGLPSWFIKQRVSVFIDNLKARAPELFSDDPKAIPMTFSFDHTAINRTNAGLSLLSLLTCMTIIPGVVSYEHQFNVKIKIGERDQYVETQSFKAYDRNYVSLIPFFALLMPSQSGSFCQGIMIGEKAIKAPQLQNIFLNMIYRLDKDRLRKLFDDKHGEKIELLDMNE